MWIAFELARRLDRVEHVWNGDEHAVWQALPAPSGVDSTC